jgi:hypothetical protein
VERMTDLSELLKGLSERGKRIVEKAILAEIDRLGMALYETRQEMSEKEEFHEKARHALITLVSAIKPKDLKVRTQNVEVTIVPLPPRRIVSPSGFIKLVSSLTKDQDLRDKVLAACISNIDWEKAVEMLRIHFNLDDVKLREITEEISRTPRVLVEVLVSTKKEGK